jgi:PPOX class probable F420-dependent enzyme
VIDADACEEDRMADVLQQGGPTQRLNGEAVGWLTTAGTDGQPQSSPVWFLWDGASLWLRSQARAGKVRNIEANPRVAFHLADDGYGGNIITIEGTASFEADLPESLLEAYFAKYGEAIRSALKMTPEQLAADYPVTVRIAPTRTRAW